MAYGSEIILGWYGYEAVKAAVETFGLRLEVGPPVPEYKNHEKETVAKV